MYHIVIQLIFVCPTGIHEKKEFILPKTKYEQAMIVRSKWLKHKEEGYTEEFNGQECTLNEVKSGKRKIIKTIDKKN